MRTLPARPLPVVVRSASPVRAVIVALSALALALGVLGVTTIPAGAVSSDPVAGVPIGFSGGGELPWLSDADLARELDAYAAAGSTWLRIDVDWSIIESTKGRYSWGNTDRVLAAAQARGLEVLAILTYTPSWATTAGTNHSPPTNVADFARFAGAAAARYAGRMKAYEVWNEPNNPIFWSTGASIAGYVSLLKASYPAIKNADPAAIVLGGSLSPGTDGGGWISPVTFVTGMYSAGAGPFMDALSVHPYSYPALPSDPSTSGWNTFYRVKNLRSIMVANGDSAKKIWLTEFGAPTGTDTSAVSEARQAAIITDGFRFARTLGYAGPLFVYSGRDRGSNLADREQNFGVIRRNWTEKPGMAAVRAAAPAPAPTTASPTSTPPPAVVPPPPSTTPTPTATVTTSPPPAVVPPPPSTTPTPTTTTTTAPPPAVTPPAPSDPGTDGATAPAPVPVVASSITSSSVVVSWTPADTGGQPVTDYVLQAARGDRPWTTWRHQATTASSTVVSGLRPNTGYRVRVAVVTSAGVGEFGPVWLRTAARSSLMTRTVAAGAALTVSRTLAKAASVRRVLNHKRVVAVFDPDGSGRAHRVGRAIASRSTLVKVSIRVASSGRLTFHYKWRGHWRVTKPHRITVLPRFFA